MASENNFACTNRTGQMDFWEYHTDNHWDSGTIQKCKEFKHLGGYINQDIQPRIAQWHAVIQRLNSILGPWLNTKKKHLSRYCRAYTNLWCRTLAVDWTNIKLKAIEIERSVRVSWIPGYISLTQEFDMTVNKHISLFWLLIIAYVIYYPFSFLEKTSQSAYYWSVSFPISRNRKPMNTH